MSNKYLVMTICYNDIRTQFLNSLLTKHGYKTISFTNVQQIPDTLYMTIPDLIIIAVENDAVSIYNAVCSNPDIGSRIPIIILCESYDRLDKAESFAAGCYDYISAPFDENEILAKIKIHLEGKRLHRWLSDKITEQTKELTEVQMETIVAMAELAESRDPLVTFHLDRIRRYCSVIARVLSEKEEFRHEINQEFISLIYYASALHDIGKIGVREGILNKCGKLTKEEFEIIASHTTKGSIALKSVIEKYPNNSFIRMSTEIIRFHHESWNGKGYPIGIAEETVPLSARIMTLSDVYDAVRSKRAYKEAKSHKEAVEEIIIMKGIHLDPRIVEVFIEAQHEFAEIYEQFKEAE